MYLHFCLSSGFGEVFCEREVYLIQKAVDHIFCFTCILLSIYFVSVNIKIDKTLQPKFGFFWINEHSSYSLNSSSFQIETLFYYGINTVDKKTDTLADHMFQWEFDEYVGLKVNTLYILRLDKAYKLFQATR